MPAERSKSGKEVVLPPPPPLRTARACSHACSSSIGQRTAESTRCPALALPATCTLLRESQHTEPLEAAPARALRSADFAALLPQVGLPTVHVRQHQREVCTFSGRVMLPVGATLIRPITGRLSLAPSSFTRRLLGWPYGWLSPQVVLRGRRRAYHVPSLSRCGEGRAFSPVVSHLRRPTR